MLSENGGPIKRWSSVLGGEYHGIILGRKKWGKYDWKELTENWKIGINWPFFTILAYFFYYSFNVDLNILNKSKLQ